jgi:tRNA pseudouridine synthase 10
LEIKKPKKRFIDLACLTQIINEKAKGKVKVLKLRFANKDMVRKLKKMEVAEKLYKIIIEFDKEVTNDEIEVLEKKISNNIIYQKTPFRVLHRRSDRIRERYIYEMKIKRLEPNRVEAKIHCQGGLYIKELITGDKGRTHPNVAEIICTKATPLELDVLEVIMGGFEK